jgi:SAM-dependent methyltransferase
MATSASPLLQDTISTFVATRVGRLKLPERSRVLDVPCGFGRHSRWLASKGFRVTALDIDAVRVSEALGIPPKDGSVQWIVSDIESGWPFAPAVFDLALVIHYCSDAVLTRARDALKPNGYLIYETFDARGQNWRALPALRSIRAMLSVEFDMLELNERPVGPFKDRAVVRLLARKKAA